MTTKKVSDVPEKALHDAAIMWHTNKVYQFAFPLNCGVNLPVGFVGVDEGIPLKEKIAKDMDKESVKVMASQLYCTFDLPITEKQFIFDALVSFKKCQAVPERIILDELSKDEQKDYACHIYQGDVKMGNCNYLTTDDIRITRKKPKGFQ